MQLKHWRPKRILALAIVLLVAFLAATAYAGAEQSELAEMMGTMSMAAILSVALIIFIGGFLMGGFNLRYGCFGCLGCLGVLILFNLGMGMLFLPLELLLDNSGAVIALALLIGAFAVWQINKNGGNE